MKLSERLYRTYLRQKALGRQEVALWFLAQSNAVIISPTDREHGPLRDVIGRFQRRQDYIQ